MNLEQLHEAKYSGSMKGSFDWFLKTFFDVAEDDEEQTLYEFKDGFSGTWIKGEGDKVVHVVLIKKYDLPGRQEPRFMLGDAWGKELAITKDPRKELFIEYCKRAWRPGDAT